MLGLLALGLWEGLVRVFAIPSYLLPGPIQIFITLVQDWGTLMESWWITMSISLAALAAAVVLGVVLAVLFASSKWIERSFFPYAVILQVTPIVAIAPLIIIWVNDVQLSLLICAWIVAFFPILSNTTLGLNSADRNLVDLFRLYRAARWQALLHLQAAVGDAVFPGRPAHLGRPGADRRGGGGVRRRHRRHAVGAGLPHPRIGLPAAASRACSPPCC